MIEDTVNPKPSSKLRLTFRGIVFGITIANIAYFLSTILDKFEILKSENMAASATYFTNEFNLFSLIAIVVIFIPLYETFIAQLVLIELLRWMRMNKITIILLASLIFGYGHYYNGNLTHGIIAFFSSAILNYLYLTTRLSGVIASYYVTAIAHMTNNLIFVLALKLFAS